MFHSLANSWRSTFARHKSSFIIRPPPKTAPRECPTPLVFVSAKAWDADSDKGMSTLSSLLSEKGFTCLQTDLALPDPQTRIDSSSMMKWYEDELRSAIRLCMIPFPPVILARASGCLVAQTYISSNPATGLVLISPPGNNAELEGVRGRDGLPILPTKIPEFDFEPYFPIAIMATPRHMRMLEQSNRLVREPETDKFIVEDLEGQQALNKVESWLDKLGI